jgi:transposase-like protein
MAVSFKGAHFPADIILTGVRWYLAECMGGRQAEHRVLAKSQTRP